MKCKAGKLWINITFCHSGMVIISLFCFLLLLLSFICLFFSELVFMCSKNNISAQTDSLTHLGCYIAFACINHNNLTWKTHYIWQTLHPGKHWNEKNNQKQSYSAPIKHESTIHITKSKDSNQIRLCVLLRCLSLWAYGFMGQGMPKLGVAGMND